MFEGNLVSCPHCGKEFEHNKINGIAVVQAAEDIEKRKRMYCRLTLDSFEKLHRDGGLTFAASKKIILDNFNDLTRDIHTIIGFGQEAE
jgi:predicted esterase